MAVEDVKELSELIAREFVTCGTVLDALLANPELVLRALGAEQVRDWGRDAVKAVWFAPEIGMRCKLQVTDDPMPGDYPVYWFPPKEAE